MLTSPTKPRSLTAQDGFTIIEVLVGMVLLAVGIFATLGVLISSSQLTLGSQVHEAAIGFAEQQIETLRQQPFASLGMTGTPTASTNSSDPNYYVQPAGTQPSCYQIEANYQAGGSPTGCESFVTGVSGATVPPGSQPITGYQGLSGSYDEYITSHWEYPSASPPNNGCVTITLVQHCLLEAEKRITIAVLPTSRSGTGTRKAIWVTTIITDPNAPLVSLP